MQAISPRPQKERSHAPTHTARARALILTLGARTGSRGPTGPGALTMDKLSPDCFVLSQLTLCECAVRQGENYSALVDIARPGAGRPAREMFPPASSPPGMQVLAPSTQQPVALGDLSPAVGPALRVVALYPAVSLRAVRANDVGGTGWVFGKQPSRLSQPIAWPPIARRAPCLEPILFTNQILLSNPSPLVFVPPRLWPELRGHGAPYPAGPSSSSQA